VLHWVYDMAIAGANALFAQLPHLQHLQVKNRKTLDELGRKRWAGMDARGDFPRFPAELPGFWYVDVRYSDMIDRPTDGC